MKTDTLVLASLTVPGRAEHVATARSLVGKTIGERHPCAETAVLLTGSSSATACGTAGPATAAGSSRSW